MTNVWLVLGLNTVEDGAIFLNFLGAPMILFCVINYLSSKKSKK
jgi:hypothetical protein